MRRQYVRGTLTATETNAISVRTSSRIYDAVSATRTWEASYPQDWENGIIEFDSTSAAEAGDKSPLDFINRLNDMMWRVGITELGFKGEITVMVSGGEESSVFRIVVEDSELSYQKAHLNWENLKKVE